MLIAVISPEGERGIRYKSVYGVLEDARHGIRLPSRHALLPVINDTLWHANMLREVEF